MTDEPQPGRQHTPEELASANADVPQRAEQVTGLNKSAVKTQERYLDRPIVNTEVTKETWDAIIAPDGKEIEGWKNEMKAREEVRLAILAWRLNAERYPAPFKLNIGFRLHVTGTRAESFENSYAPVTVPITGHFVMEGANDAKVDYEFNKGEEKTLVWSLPHLAFVNFGRSRIKIKLDNHLIAGYKLPRVEVRQLPQRSDTLEVDFAADVDANLGNDGHVIELFIHEKPRHENALPAEQEIEVIEEEEKAEENLEEKAVKIAEEAKKEGLEWKTPDKWEVKKITAELRELADAAKELQALITKHAPPLGPEQKGQWEREMAELDGKLQPLLRKGSRLESYILHATTPVEFGEVMEQVLLILGMFEHIIIDRFQFITVPLEADVQVGSPDAKKRAQAHLKEIAEIRKKYKGAIDRISAIYPEAKERLPVDLPDRKVVTGEESPETSPVIIASDPPSGPTPIGFAPSRGVDFQSRSQTK